MEQDQKLAKVIEHYLAIVMLFPEASLNIHGVDFKKLDQNRWNVNALINSNTMEPFLTAKLRDSVSDITLFS